MSAYHDADPRSYFLVPFTTAAVLLLADGLLSYLSPNRERFGRRWYNVVLGVALLLLTWFDLESSPSIHYPAAFAFFGLFIGVIAYTSLLGVIGRPKEAAATNGIGPVDQVLAEVSLAFIGLLAVTLAGWWAGLISFFFFEVFALLNFALYYVQGVVNPYPFNDYVFTIDWLNRFFRFLKIMAPA